MIIYTILMTMHKRRAELCGNSPNTKKDLRSYDCLPKMIITLTAIGRIRSLEQSPIENKSTSQKYRVLKQLTWINMRYSGQPSKHYIYLQKNKLEKNGVKIEHSFDLGALVYTMGITQSKKIMRRGRNVH